MEYFKIKNYKAFRGETVVDLAPLTMLFGKNNVGKSALARLLPSIVRSSQQQCDESDFLNVSLAGSNFGTSSFFHGDSSACSIGFSLGEDVYIEYDLFKDRHSSKISSISVVRNGQVEYKLIRDLPSRQVGYSAIKSSDYQDFLVEKSLVSELAGCTVTVSFFGMQPVSWRIKKARGKRNKDASQHLFSYLEKARVYVLALTSRVHWLGPLRCTPQILERVSITNSRMNEYGEEAVQLLAKDEELLNKTSQLFERIVKYKLTISDTGLGEDKVVTLLSYQETTVKIPISECGTGFSQLLPIVVLGAQAILGRLGKEPILIFESPELHLHDAIQDDLGDFFIDIIQAQPHAKILFETHSENLMLALQLKIAEKKLNHKSFVVHSIYPNKSVAQIDKVVFDEFGIPSENWNIKNFSTASELNRKIARVYTKSLSFLE